MLNSLIPGANQAVPAPLLTDGEVDLAGILPQLPAAAVARLLRSATVLMRLQLAEEGRDPDEIRSAEALFVSNALKVAAERGDQTEDEAHAEAEAFLARRRTRRREAVPC